MANRHRPIKGTRAAGQRRRCDIGIAPAPAFPYVAGAQWSRVWCGRSSGVEHNLAKVGVEGSNPFARSN